MAIRVKIKEFKEARIQAGYSQRALSKAIAACSNYVHQLEAGERNPSPRRAKDLAETLNKNFSDIFLTVCSQM